MGGMMMLMVAIVRVRMRMADEASLLVLVRRGLGHLVVVAGPGGRDECLVGGVLGIDVSVLVLVDLVELLATGHGEATGLSGHFVGRKDGEGRLIFSGRKDDAAGITRLGRSIGRRDATTSGKGLGNDQIDLVGMTGRGDAQTPNADVLAVILGLTGGTGQVGRFVDLDGPFVVVVFVVEALADAPGLAVDSSWKTAVGLVVGGDQGGRGDRQKGHGKSGSALKGCELHAVVGIVVIVSVCLCDVKDFKSGLDLY